MFQSGLEITDFFESKRVQYRYYGRLSEIDFLKKLYDLKKMPSFDSRYDDAEGDIWQHTVNNDDYEEGWIFQDERFGLLNGEDKTILDFLCCVFHPAVRDETGYWREFLNEVNCLLRNDGYELYSQGKMSGRDVYGWRKYNSEDDALFIPFSQRHKKEIKDKTLVFTLSRNTRSQIYKVLERHSTIYRESDETGWQYNITTVEYVFRDISQFYKPKCYDNNGKYVETGDMEQFIMKTSPYCVMDAIEFFEKYNSDGDFSSQINALFKLNSVSYKLKDGQVECTFDVEIGNEDISSIPEQGLKELITEAVRYYQNGNKQLAVEKLWDAFERLKTFYSPALNKSASANKIIDAMSGSNQHYKEMYEVEFRALTDIGNNYRIRHHETTKIDITDSRQYDYFYKRCLALISVAILYLEGGANS